MSDPLGCEDCPLEKEIDSLKAKLQESNDRYEIINSLCQILIQKESSAIEVRPFSRNPSFMERISYLFTGTLEAINWREVTRR